MAKDLDTYLKELQASLTAAGADRALVQDALFDAEEHLRAEMAERYEGEPASPEEYQSRFAAVMEGYGAPDEVAAAYLGAPSKGATDHGEATSEVVAAAEAAASSAPAQRGNAPAPAPAQRGNAPAPAPAQRGNAPAQRGNAPAPAPAPAQRGAWRQVFGVVIDPSVYKVLLYMLLSLVTGVAYFSIVATGLSTAGGMLVLIVGIPLFLLVLGIVRGMALLESRLVEGLLGTRMPRRERAELPQASWLERVVFWVKDARTWASLAYMLLMLPLGTAYFSIAVTGLATGLALIGSPFGDWASHHAFTWHGTDYIFSLPHWAMPIAVIAGLLILLVWLHLIRWIGRGHAAFAKRMLVRI